MKINNIVKNLVCLVIAILLSFMEAQFFINSSYYYIALIVLLIVTVPIIYLYFLPKHETMILFLYSIILVYILDLVGIDINIKLFLMTLFFILVLFAHSLYTANAIKTNHKKPNFLVYFILLSIVFFINSLLSFGVYQYVLKPNVNEKNQLYISYMDQSEATEALNQADDEDNQGSGGAGGGIEEPVDWIKILKWIIILLLLLILLYFLYKLIYYKIWIWKLYRLPLKERVIAMYSYFIMALGIIGFRKENYDTEFEYLGKLMEKECLPFEIDKLDNLTKEYVQIKYGDKAIKDEAYIYIELFFKGISKEMRKYLGFRKYITKYIFNIDIGKIKL